MERCNRKIEENAHLHLANTTSYQKVFKADAVYKIYSWFGETVATFDNLMTRLSIQPPTVHTVLVI